MSLKEGKFDGHKDGPDYEPSIFNIYRVPGLFNISPVFYSILFKDLLHP